MSIKQIIDGCWTFSDGEKVCYPYPADTGGIIPTGDINITENGEYDVTEYANAIVNVDVGITPTGDINITENGEYDVTEFANAIVNVASGGGDEASVLDSLIDRSITSASGSAEAIGYYAFAQCLSLTEVDFQKAKSIEYGAFNGCRNLATVNVPSVETVGSSGFGDCTAINKLILPKCTKILMSAFYNCGAQIIDIMGSRSNTIQSSAFLNCKNLKALVIRASALVKLGTASALDGTPISNSTGYIYVPSTLVDTYKSATNWSTFALQFRALEDYTVDGTITGELDESKI